VVNLVELRFPSLVPSLAAFDSPWEAVQATYADRPVAYVVSCPSQRTALLLQSQAAAAAGCAPPQAEYLVPDLVRQAAMVALTGGGPPAAAACKAAAATPARTDPGAADSPTTLAAIGTTAPRTAPSALSAPPSADADGPLQVTGMSHVMAVLEKVENGLLDDVSAIEPYACEGGCFGSPLFLEDHHVAARRWAQGQSELKGAAAAREGAAARPAAATARRRPYAARPGIRLDADMGRAIQKLGRLQALTRSLPGRDCGACGAPTCAALAEDIVMERAGIDLCPYAVCEKEDADT